MSVASQFLLNNVLPALVAGSLTWAFVHLAVHVFRIQHGKLRLCLYLAPLLKSTLVLLGLALVVAWPRQVFGDWARQAVPTQTVLPVFILLTGIAVLVRWALARRAQGALLTGATPVPEDGRLAAALDEVMALYRANAERIRARCRFEGLPQRPRLLTQTNLASPAVIVEGDPAIVFPSNLLARLGDAELRGALAHELAHIYLRQPGNCFSSEGVRVFSTLNPFAGVIAAQLHREEEKACDDVAVDVLGGPETYAGMLMKTYRYAAASRTELTRRLQFVPQLLGVRPMLSERVEHLMERDTQLGWMRQRCGFAVTWLMLVLLFFSA